jgi:hypothetical protein
MSAFPDKSHGSSVVTRRTALVISFILISTVYFYSAIVTATSLIEQGLLGSPLIEDRGVLIFRTVHHD